MYFIGQQEHSKLIKTKNVIAFFDSISHFEKVNFSF